MTRTSALDSKKSPLQSPVLLGLIVAFLALILYSNTFSHNFTVDDPLVITKNEFVQKGIAGISSIWTSSYLQGFNGEVDAAYRPLSLSLFALEKSVFGSSSSNMHFMHVIYYAIGIFLCYLFTYKLFRDNALLALFTTILFAVHPIHTEVVNNLKSRDEIMLLIGIMGMGYFYLKYLDKASFLILLYAILFYLVALFSKESAVSYFLIIPLLALFYKEKWSRSMWISTGLFLGVSLFYLTIRTVIVGGYDIEMTYMNNALVGQGSWIGRFPDVMALMGKYLVILFVPYPLSVDYSYNAIPLNGWLSIWPYISLLAYGAISFWCILAIKKKNIYAVLVPWFLLTIVVASNLVVLIGSTFAERFLFIPSFAFCAIVVYALHKAIGEKYRIVIAIVCAIFAVFTFIRNGHWQSDEKLFSRDVQFQENNARVLTFHGKFNYESAKSLQGKEKERKLRIASESLRKAVEIAPDYMVANHFQGFVAKEMGNSELAKESFAKVTELNPDFSTGLLQYAISLSKAGNYTEAIEAYKKLLENGDKSFVVIYNKGYSHFKLKQYKLAEADFLLAYKIEPQNTALLSSLIKVYRDGLKDLPNAIKYNGELIKAKK